MKRFTTAFDSATTRRNFLLSGISAGVAPLIMPRIVSAQQPGAITRPLRVAAINSIFRLRSHAYHIVGRMVFGFQKDGLHHQPSLQVVRMYDDQAPADDLGPSFC